MRGVLRDGSCPGLPAPRNVVNSDSILQDLGANDVLGSQRHDGLCTIEVGVKESYGHPHLVLAHARPPAESVVADSELLGQRRQPWVDRPELKASNKSGGEEVRIDPANTAPVQSPITHELYDICVRHDRCLVHSLVVGL